ncbi:MAG: hypothetical protein IKR56_00770 [Lachnospiraceae bacterium]|nr:hypothetical protein [Lachnospiraceae bacterium]
MGSKNSDSENGRGVFLIDTDIQLLNAARFILSRDLFGKMDAIIQMKSRNAKERIAKLRQIGIFDNVYDLELDKHSKLEKFYILLALMFPGIYLKKRFGMDIKGRYDEIYLAFATKTFDFIIAGSGCKNIIGYDDGMGSYIGDPYTDNYKNGYMKMRRLLGHDYRVDIIYLNNPACYHGVNGKELFNILASNGTCDDTVINELFSFRTPDDLEGKKYIFLNMGITDLSGYIEWEKDLAECMDEAVEGECIVRLHPSEKRSQVYESMQRDKTCNMWELICARQIGDDSVLTGFFSTAQFSPKLMNDAEPYLIFTFMMSDDFPADKKEKFADYVRYFRTKYRDGSKIYLPESKEEYKEIIKSIYERNISTK